MIPLDSADSAVFSSIKTITDYKFVEIFCTWVRKLKKLHFFWRTISWKTWRFQISRKKFIRQKRVAELVSLLPCNLETRDRNAGEATFPFFSFFCTFLPLRLNRNSSNNIWREVSINTFPITIFKMYSKEHQALQSDFDSHFTSYIKDIIHSESKFETEYESQVDSVDSEAHS